MTTKERLTFRAMRKRLQIPQVLIAKEVGVSRPKFTAWENGNGSLTPDEECRIGDAIDRVLAKRGLPGVVTPEQAREDLREGAVLARRRTQYGFTQVQLEGKTKIDQGAISAFEKGYADLAPAKVAQLFQALDSLIEERRTQREVLHNSVERAWRKRHSKKLPAASQVLTGNLSSLRSAEAASQAFQREMRLKALQEAQRLSTERLIAGQQELIDLLQEFVKFQEKENAEQVASLQKKVNELRNLYELETRISVDTVQAEELRERLSAVPIKEGKV